jgi:S-adenosylmethionine decarboxylase
MWGKHLILDCAGCPRELISNKALIRSFVEALVPAIDMKAVGAPVIEYLSPEPRLAGYSLMQLIETSSITGHFCDASGEAYLDIFSCKDFNARDALDVVTTYFAPDKCMTTVLVRDASLATDGP